jgi:nicotinamide-nucleotide amidase
MPDFAPTDGGTTPAMAAGPLSAWQIAVGDEMLTGHTIDTNSQQVQRAFEGCGVAFRRIAVVPDDPEAIAAVLGATDHGGLVVLTGGLGSTPDDLTREAVARWAGVELHADPGIAAGLRRRYERMGLPWRESLARQTMVPAGLTPLANPAGSAPALVGPLAGRLIVLLPGVPGELRALLPLVRARLEQAGHLPPRRPSLLVRTAQMAEIAVAEICQPLREAYPGLHWAWRLARWGVDIRVETTDAERAPAVLAEVADRLRQELRLAVFAWEPRELNDIVQEIMIERGLTLAVAESCTAGLLGARLTETAGSSRYFRGGMLVYADDMKEILLGVSPQVLSRQGAVSRATAEAMASACRRECRCDFGLAITGIAGPEGGSDTKPVGTTWIGIASPAGVLARRYCFPGDRSRNRQLAVAAALDSLRRLLMAPAGVSPWLKTDSWGCDA